jgi:competence protein ComEC
MLLNNFPVLKLLSPYILGVFCGYLSLFDPKVALLAFFLQILCLIIVLILRHKINYWAQKGVGLLFHFIFLFAGFLITSFHFHQPFQTLSSANLSSQGWKKGEIIEPIQEREKSIKIIVRINNQKVLLYLQKDSTALNLQPGDWINIDIKLQQIASPKNPDYFNYQIFMKRKGIYLSGYADRNHWNKKSIQRSFHIKWFFYSIQQKLSKILLQSGLTGSEYQVAAAILLGNDDTMEPELKAQYSNAGVSHILCVSGMHVGIIFMILNVLLTPLDWSKKTRLIKTILLFVSVWSYAAITGLSPSVIRSATMFSFVLIGGLLHRTTNIYQSLFASLFIILVIDPLLIFDLGFQLSYLAVFGIVIFQKPICAIYKPKTKVGNYFWSLCSVSLAAQISTFPISIYYFHQFPNYFLLANLLVIFLSFCVMIGGIMVIVFSFFPWFSRILAILETFLVRLMNSVIEGVQNLPGAVTEHIPISFEQMIILYIIVIFIYLTFHNKNKISFFGLLISLNLFLFSSNWQHYNHQHQSELIIFSIPNRNLILCQNGSQSYIISDSIKSRSDPTFKYNVESHILKRNMKPLFIDIEQDTSINSLCKREKLIAFKGKQLIWITKNNQTFLSGLHADYLYLTENTIDPIILEKVNCQMVILSNNIKTSQEKKWEKACKNRNIEVYSIREQGAFILKLD